MCFCSQAMGEVHDFIEARGKQATLKFGDFERSVVEAAVAYMGDEDGGIGFLYSWLVQAALPHKKLADGKGWQIEGERVTLIIRTRYATRFAWRTGSCRCALRLQSTSNPALSAIRGHAHRSREVVLGKSLRDWLLRMGIPQGGNSILGVRGNRRGGRHLAAHSRVVIPLRHGDRFCERNS